MGARMLHMHAWLGNAHPSPSAPALSPSCITACWHPLLSSPLLPEFTATTMPAACCPCSLCLVYVFLLCAFVFAFLHFSFWVVVLLVWLCIYGVFVLVYDYQCLSDMRAHAFDNALVRPRSFALKEQQHDALCACALFGVSVTCRDSPLFTHAVLLPCALCFLWRGRQAGHLAMSLLLLLLGQEGGVEGRNRHPCRPHLCPSALQADIPPT